MRVESIDIYPVKATKAVPVSEAQVELSGLRHDRRWAVVDLDGRRLNATHHDSLLAVTATPDEAGNLMLSAEGREPQPMPVKAPPSHGSATSSPRTYAWSGRTIRPGERCHPITAATVPSRSAGQETNRDILVQDKGGKVIGAYDARGHSMPPANLSRAASGSKGIGWSRR